MIPVGSAMIEGSGYSVIVPEVVIWPTECDPLSVSQRLPLGPTVMFTGAAEAEMGYWVTWPDGVILAIACAPFSQNQRLPSGPVVIPSLNRRVEPTGNSVNTPLVVTRPIRSPKFSVN